MALISMAVYDTEQNKRSEYTQKTLASLLETVNHSKHRIFIIDNNSCYETKDIFKKYSNVFTIITLIENIGTARAVNMGWEKRLPYEHCIKMDNDVVVNQTNWVEKLEEAIERDTAIGICGLKRKDCWESPDCTKEGYKSKLYMLPHIASQSWIVGEEVEHVIGTCQMYNWRLLDKIGYLYQPHIYGYDDCLSAIRCKLAGFKNVFLPYIDIDYLDREDNSYTKEKQALASKGWNDYLRIKNEYESGRKNIHQNIY